MNRLLGGLGVLWLAGAGTGRAVEPRITEFMADNQTGLSDGDGDEVDWVEIHNPNPVAMDLTGWYLSDAAAVGKLHGSGVCAVLQGRPSMAARVSER